MKTKAALVLFTLLLLVYMLIEAQGEGDFYIYMSASRDLFSGVNIYDTYYGNGFHYLYSLFFAVILYPFSFLPFYPVKLAWLLFNAFLLYRVFKLLFSFFNLSVLSGRQQKIFYALVFLFSARFIHDNFHSSQITVLILYTCVQGLYWIFYSDKWLWGCLLIAIGINIKLMPLVLLPYLLYRGRFREFATVVLLGLVLLALPALAIGIKQNSFLLGEWWALINPNNKIHVLDVSERSFHSLTTLLSTLFVKNVPDLLALPLKRNIADVSLHTLSLIILFSRLLLAAFALFFLRTRPFRPAPGATHQYIEMAYLLAVVPLVFPHQQHYAFLFIIPAAIFVIYDGIAYYRSMKASQKIVMVSSGLFIYLCCNLKLILGEFNPYYDHYKILTYGALWMLVLLAYVSRMQAKRTGINP